MEIEYELVKERCAFDLLLKVRELISDGWEPQGGIAYNNIIVKDEENIETYIQVMIRKTNYN